MTYRAIAAMSRDHELTLRLSACAAASGERDPEGFVRRNLWGIVTQPGWGERFAEALDNHASATQARLAAQAQAEAGGEIAPGSSAGGAFPLLLEPGADESVISDEMILEAIRAVTPTPLEVEHNHVEGDLKGYTFDSMEGGTE